MAKGDHSRVQNSIDSNYNAAQQQTTNLQGETSNRTQQMQGLYNTATAGNLNDYNSIMNNYNQFLSGGAGSGGSSGGSSGGNNPQSQQQFFQQMFPAGSTLSPDMLTQNEQALNAQGIQLVRNAEGVPGKIKLSDGRIIDVIQGAGAGTNKSQWLDTSGGGGAANSNPFSGYGALDPAITGLLGFSQNGGFSPQDIQNIRARAEAPIRSEYSQAQDELARQKNLSGGYAPNAPAAAAKMARDQAYATSDAETNANAAIGQMVQQGKLYGLTGLSNIGLQGVSQGLGGLSGASGLYGTTPGLTNTFGNQVLNSMGQTLSDQSMLNSLAGNRVNAQLGLSSVPGNFQSAMGNVGSALGLGGAIAGMINPIANIFSSSPATGYTTPFYSGNNAGTGQYNPSYGLY